MCVGVCAAVGREVRQLLYCAAGEERARPYIWKPRNTAGTLWLCTFLPLATDLKSCMLWQLRDTLRSTLYITPPHHHLLLLRPCQSLFPCFMRFCAGFAQWQIRFTVSSLAIKRHRVRALLSGTIWDQMGGAAGPGRTVQFVMSILGKWQCHSFAV